MSEERKRGRTKLVYNKTKGEITEERIAEPGQPESQMSVALRVGPELERANRKIEDLTETVEQLEICAEKRLKLAEELEGKYELERLSKQHFMNALMAAEQSERAATARVAELEAQLVEVKEKLERSWSSREIARLKGELEIAWQQAEAGDKARAELEARLAEAYNGRGEVESLFRVAMREIHDIAEGALGYEQACDAQTAVSRLASRYKNERQHSEWLQSECNKAVDAMERANSKKAKATVLIGRYKGVLKTIADWPFDIRGDCVATARRLATAALHAEKKSSPAAIVRWHKYNGRGEGVEDRDPHSDDNPDHIRFAVDEALEEVAGRIESGWRIPEGEGVKE